MACPICEKEADPKYRPFCSRRCADVDLGRWLKGSYAIPSDEDTAASDAPPDSDDTSPLKH
jgi:endogenous inhibitor of DNA gyrase (YacG/DUF329 family)